ncbi:MAG: penicillin-binding protein 1A [Gammaproteobacteria bacterium]|nr:penicillin-binding protein 1A [Gammaproteobacteria bacterium]
MIKLKTAIKWGIRATGAAVVLGVIGVVGAYMYIEPRLPETSVLKDTRYQVPLRVYTADGKLMAEFGEKRRQPLKYNEIPEDMIHAVLGAEDDRYFEHPGVDYQGLLRAVGLLVLTGEKMQGGSTITMQVARNFFLSREKTFLRKFSEILLALKIEDELTKEEILELYLNKIYLGNRAYGVGAAAQIYYGKPLNELNLAQMAMIAGLPKAPSRFNPIVNPERSKLRRDYVLKRMHDLKNISDEQYAAAIKEPVTARLHGLAAEIEAPYAAEMVRAQMVARFGEEAAYTEGYRVYTTIDSRLQLQANRSLRYNLLAYEERHGYRGPEDHVNLLEMGEMDELDKVIKLRPDVSLLQPGVVLQVNEKDAYVYIGDGHIAHLCWKGIQWAAPYKDGNYPGPAPKTAADVLAEGDVIRVYDAGGGKWSLGQIPEVEGALVSLRSKDGGMISVVGGYDFDRSKFNRADQALRQPGSNFKPFVYAAALEKGYTAATIINDAPVVFEDSGLEDTWRPENYSGQFFGPTRFREALVTSRNLVSIRILRSIGVQYALEYTKRFGFDPAHLPHDLSLALGSASVTPLQIAKGYAVFSNGGFAVEPYLITRIEDGDGKVLYTANPAVVCDRCEKNDANSDDSAELAAAGSVVAPTAAKSGSVVREGVVAQGNRPNHAPRVVSPEVAYIMDTIMRDIVQRGTATRAKVLGRNDLAGKTGTTNDQRDAWFSGFNGEIVTTAWVGFDRPHPLGDAESGARAALPMWISYMREALNGRPETPLTQPPGVVTVRVDPETGLLADSSVADAIYEVFLEENVPKRKSDGHQGGNSPAENDSGGDIPQLF